MTNLHARDAVRFRIVSLCGLFGRTKQAYYKMDECRLIESSAMRSFALEFAGGVRSKDPGIGMMKLWYMYRHEFRG